MFEPNCTAWNAAIFSNFSVAKEGDSSNHSDEKKKEEKDKHKHKHHKDKRLASIA